MCLCPLEFNGAVAKSGGGATNARVSFLHGLCDSAFSGRLEDPADDHRVRVRLPVSKHRPLTFPQGVHRFHPLQRPICRCPVLKCTLRPQDPFQPPLISLEKVVQVFHLTVLHCR